jgi:hypothetical protein
VVADRTVLAEVYAKVALILGAEHRLAYLNRVPGIEGLIYTVDAQVVYTPGFDPILDRSSWKVEKHLRRSKKTFIYSILRLNFNDCPLKAGLHVRR